MLLVCLCANSGVVSATLRQVLARRLREHENVRLVTDLCGEAEARSPVLQAAAQAKQLTVLACHPRAVWWLFHYAGVPLQRERVTFLNARRLHPEVILSQLGLDPEPVAPTTSTHPGNSFSGPGNASPAWLPWFPVIDRDRCRRCRQCLNFCLFGVYEDDGAGGVQVRNPRQCKPYCPACARICPHAAIIFPKCPEEPINGAEITDEEALRSKIRIRLEALLGPDPYAALARRRGQHLNSSAST